MRTSSPTRPLLALLAVAAASGISAQAAQAATCPKPIALRAAAHGGSELRVSWKAPAGVPATAAYRVWRDGAVVGQTGRLRMTVPARPGRHAIAVGVVGAHGAAPRCAAKVRVRLAAPTTSLAAPEDLGVAVTSDTAVELSWRKVTSAYAYRVLRDGVVVRQTRALRSTVAMVPGRAYDVSVVAVDRHGRRGAATSALSVNTRQRPPAAPTGLGVSAGDASSLQVAWAPSAAGSAPVRAYRVMRDGAVVGQTAQASYRLGNLAAARQYTIAVQAVDSRGYLSVPAVISAFTQKPGQSSGASTYAFLLASTDSSYDDFTAHYAQIGTVIPTYFNCNKQTMEIQGRDDPRITGFARLHGVKVAPRFDCQGSDAAHRLLTDPGSRKTAIDGLVDLVGRYRYDGINLDIEATPAADRAALTAFVAEVSDRLHAIGATVSMEASAKIADVKNHPRSTAFDYQALSQSADRILVMCWGLHWSTSAPGPVSDITWFTKIVRYVATIPNKDRFVLAVPFYATDWPAGGGIQHPSSMLSAADVPSLGGVPARDAVSDEMHLSYTDGQGIGHDVWWLDTRSIEDRLSLAAANGLGGVAMWRLGQEDPAAWATPSLAG